jgi:hypothetical protein
VFNLLLCFAHPVAMATWGLLVGWAELVGNVGLATERRSVLLLAAAGIPKVLVRGELDQGPGMSVTYRETEWYLYIRGIMVVVGWWSWCLVALVVVKKTLVCACGFGGGSHMEGLVTGCSASPAHSVGRNHVGG